MVIVMTNTQCTCVLLGSLLIALFNHQVVAATYELGDDLTVGLYTAGSDSAPIFHDYSETHFIDRWHFTLAEPSNLWVSIVDVETFSVGLSLNLIDLTIRLENSLGQVLGQASEEGAGYFNVDSLLAGESYTLVVSGTVDGFLGGQYWASMRVQPVPLPAGLWLLASALLVLFAKARSPNQAKA